MIKVEVIEKFTLEDYKKLKNVKKVVVRKENEFGVGDTFECDKEMVDYLTGNNAFKKEVVKVIEVKPEKIKKNELGNPIGTREFEEKPKKKTTKKTTKKKKEK